MKTSTFKSVLVGLVVATFGSSAFAAGNVVVNNYRNTDYAIVSAVLSADDNYRVAIKDADGNLIYRSETISNANMFQRLIDLSSLTNGVYKIYVDGSSNDAIASFEVNNNRLVTKNEVADAKTNAAFLLKDNSLLYITHLNPAKKGAWMEIADNYGHTVYSASLPEKEVYNGLYQVNSLPKGKYVVSVSSENDRHSYEFNK